MVDIDPETGWITTKIEFDYENTEKLSFKVVATDNGTPRKSGHVMVKVTVVDEVEVFPVFEQQEYVFKIYEMAPSGGLRVVMVGG